MTTTLTKAQTRKLDKLTRDQSYQHIQFRVCEVLGDATVVCWISRFTYREIMMTKGGRVLNDFEDTSLGR